MTILNKKLAFLSKSQLGMTLVEILVALGIMAIMMTATITYLPNYRANQQLRQTSLDIMNSLRKGQTLAIAPDDSEADGYMWVQDKEGKYCGTSYLGKGRVIALVPIKKGQDNMAENSNDANIKLQVSKDKCFAYDNYYAGSKIKFKSTLPTMYFEVKTGRIFTDNSLSIKVAGNQEIKFQHINTKPGGLAYIVKIVNDNFQLIRGRAE